MNRKSIAEKFNISIETVRYYENMGLLKPKRDKMNGYRIYSDRDEIKLDMVIRFKNFGFKLTEIRTFFDLLEGYSKNETSFIRFIDFKIEDIDKQIKGLKLIKESLNKFKDKEDIESCKIYSKLIETS